MLILIKNEVLVETSQIKYVRLLANPPGIYIELLSDSSVCINNFASVDDAKATLTNILIEANKNETKRP